MPRLLLEGKSITALLAQVRAEHGDDVTIVAAEKVRSGGIGGFFARESYALTVEVEEPVGMPAVAATTRGTTGALESQEGLHARAADAHAPGTLLDLAAAIDAAEATENSVILATRPMHSTVRQPTLSTASPEFTAILERLTALDAPKAEPAPEPQADAYTRLREVLAEIAPHIDLTTSVPIVLVIPPAVATEAPPPPLATAPPAIPQQGRHRRAAAFAAE